MKAGGGYSTLGHLYQKVLQVPGVKWKTKTPFASIRRIVQVSGYFFRIRPGLWALTEYRDKLPPEIMPGAKRPAREQTEFGHSYYQGLLLEIGNLRKLQTHVARQDKNKRYLDRILGDVASMKQVPPFGFPNAVRKASSVDVVWFNDRNMPHSFIEVEHSTDINNSLLKFLELQDFHSGFFIVADKARSREFQSKLLSPAFKDIKRRTTFFDYERTSKLHSQLFEFADRDWLVVGA
ncbi:MAG: hypothetical protein HYZ01_13215 [Ignavibacteriales bacterium]|nr:hypothetical protein [Ignavibacteriales bacterium]